MVFRRPHGPAPGPRHPDRHRSPPPRRPAHGDLVDRGGAVAPGQPGLGAGHPTRPAQPDDRGARGEPRRGAHRPTGRRAPRCPALGGPTRGHPPRPAGLRTPPGPPPGRDGDGPGHRAGGRTGRRDVARSAGHPAGRPRPRSPGWGVGGSAGEGLRARRGGGGGRRRDRRSDRGAWTLGLPRSGSGRDRALGGRPGPAPPVRGEALPTPIVVWWNFVGRSRDELGEAGREWNAGSERFGTTTSRLARIPTPRPPWADPPT
jgi:hypothetical protein